MWFWEVKKNRSRGVSETNNPFLERSNESNAHGILNKIDEYVVKGETDRFLFLFWKAVKKSKSRAQKTASFPFTLNRINIIIYIIWIETTDFADIYIYIYIILNAAFCIRKYRSRYNASWLYDFLLFVRFLIT